MLGPSGTVWTMLVERRCFDLGRSPSGQNWNIVIFRVKDPFRDALEKPGCEHTSPSRGRLHCLNVSVQVFGSSYQQPGTPVAEESTVTCWCP